MATTLTNKGVLYPNNTEGLAGDATVVNVATTNASMIVGRSASIDANGAVSRYPDLGASLNATAFSVSIADSLGVNAFSNAIPALSQNASVSIVAGIAGYPTPRVTQYTYQGYAFPATANSVEAAAVTVNVTTDPGFIPATPWIRRTSANAYASSTRNIITKVEIDSFTPSPEAPLATSRKGITQHFVNTATGAVTTATIQAHSTQFPSAVNANRTTIFNSGPISHVISTMSVIAPAGAPGPVANLPTRHAFRRFTFSNTTTTTAPLAVTTTSSLPAWAYETGNSEKAYPVDVCASINATAFVTVSDYNGPIAENASYPATIVGQQWESSFTTNPTVTNFNYSNGDPVIVGYSKQWHGSWLYDANTDGGRYGRFALAIIDIEASVVNIHIFQSNTSNPSEFIHIDSETFDQEERPVSIINDRVRIVPESNTKFLVIGEGDDRGSNIPKNWGNLFELNANGEFISKGNPFVIETQYGNSFIFRSAAANTYRLFSTPLFTSWKHLDVTGYNVGFPHIHLGLIYAAPNGGFIQIATEGIVRGLSGLTGAEQIYVSNVQTGEIGNVPDPSYYQLVGAGVNTSTIILT